MKRFLIVGSCCCCAGLLFAEDEGTVGKDRTFKEGDEIIVVLNEKTDSAEKVTARIVDTLSNGKLKIHASKSFENFEATYTFELNGIINRDDISSENTISEEHVANLQIRKRKIKKELEENEEQEILTLPVGVHCTVHLVRDKYQHALSGKILQINDQWFILEKGRDIQWIPREGILYVSVKASDL